MPGYGLFARRSSAGVNRTAARIHSVYPFTPRLPHPEALWGSFVSLVSVRAVDSQQCVRK